MNQDIKLETAVFGFQEMEEELVRSDDDRKGSYNPSIKSYRSKKYSRQDVSRKID